MNKAAKEPTTITTNNDCTLTARSKLFLIHSKRPTAYEEKYSTIPCTPSSVGHYLRENIKMNVSSR